MEITPEIQEIIDAQITEAKTKWVAEELTPIQTELATLKPAKKTDKEVELETKEAELWDKEKSLHIKEKGLSDFADFINGETVEDLDKSIEKFNAILEAKKLNNSYIPEGHKTTDAYSVAEKNKNVEGMIGSKLSKLFSK